MAAELMALLWQSTRQGPKLKPQYCLKKKKKDLHKEKEI